MYIYMYIYIYIIIYEECKPREVRFLVILPGMVIGADTPMRIPARSLRKRGHAKSFSKDTASTLPASPLHRQFSFRISSNS